MKWHLLDLDGRIVRSVEATSAGEARFRLAPIPKGALVVSAASYADAPEPAPKKVKDMSKARHLTAAHRQAIAQSNTRRMLERRGWVKPNPEVRKRINQRYVANKLAENPHYLAERRAARRANSAAKHDRIAARVIGLTMEGMPDKEIAAQFNVPEQVVQDIRRHYGVPDSRAREREKRLVLLWYYRDLLGKSLRQTAITMGMFSTKHLRTLDTSTLRANGVHEKLA